MGAIVLIVFVLVEVIMLVVTAKQRGNSAVWLRNRTVVSVCEAVVLALIMALPFPQIAFDFRWAALLAVLVVRAVIALIVYFARRKKAQTEMPHRTARMVLNVLGSIVVIALAAVPALLFPFYDGLPTTGSYAVKEAHAIMVDESRVDAFEDDGSFCEVPVWLYYPDTSDGSVGGLPLVVFSHGAFGFHESNYSLCAELASNGYVVAAIDYPHHAFFAPDTQGQTVTVDTTFISQAMNAQGGNIPEEESYRLSQEWMSLRMASLGFALDTLEATIKSGEAEEGAWYFDSDEQRALVLEALALADADNVGLVGHSMGGATSVGQGRLRSEVGAVVDLDGTMFTEYASFDNGTYTFLQDPYPAPLLSVDNEDHYASNTQSAERQNYVNNYVLDNANVSAHTYFKGSGHMNFTDLPLFSPALASLLGTGSVDSQTCIEQTNALVLAWFNEYLKGEGRADIAESY